MCAFICTLFKKTINTLTYSNAQKDSLHRETLSTATGAARIWIIKGKACSI